RQARVEQVAASARFESAERYVSLASSWWDTAVRLEGLPAERVRGYEAELRAALESRFGQGPFETPGRDNLLYAVR
ncbi:MAG: hypothetical protein M3024_11085, partial [Candidatus Dormibacteraeota bacterium]|nr:hypothetical protein [Candidatus Dormibacteraeota bacterium]